MATFNGAKARRLMHDMAVSNESDWKPSYSDAEALLAQLRKPLAPEMPEVVYRVGSWVLANHARRLGDNVWTVREQLVKAMFSLKMVNEALELLQLLADAFPDSSRVIVLRAMASEAFERQEDSKTMLEEALRRNSANRVASRRLVALTEATGTEAEAIEKMNKHLIRFTDDIEAWVHLAQLHTSAGRLKEATFCWEELVLLQPKDPHFHCRLGESLASLDSAVESLEQARKHISHAVLCSGGQHFRTLVALATVCQRLAAAQKGRNSENERVHQLAMASLDKISSSSSTSGASAGAGGSSGGAETSVQLLLRALREGAAEAGLDEGTNEEA